MRALTALFTRSLREDCRGRLPYFLRAIFAALILLVIWSNTRSLAYWSAPGLRLLQMIALMNLALIALLAVGPFSSAIAEEKEDATLALLRMTRLNPFSILLGKAGSRVVAALMLLAVQVPFVVLCVALGGVTYQHVLKTYAMLGMLVFFLSGLGLLCSVLRRTTIQAGLFTALFAGILYVGQPFLYVLTSSRNWMFNNAVGPNAWERTMESILYMHPIAVLEQMLRPAAVSAARYQPMMLLTAGLGLLCYALAWLFFLRYCGRAEENAVPKAKRLPSNKKLWWRSKRPARPSKRYALLWKDFHFFAGGRRGMLLRAIAALVIYGVCLWITYRARLVYLRYDKFGETTLNWNAVFEDALWGYTVIAAMCAGLELVLMAGRYLGVERQRLTLSSLVGLPWPLWRVLRQKALGGLTVLLPWFFVFLVACALAQEATMEAIRNLSEWQHWHRDDVLAVGYFTLHGLFLLALIALLSLYIRRGATLAAIAACALYNITMVIVVEEVTRSDEEFFFGIGIVLSAVGLVTALYRIQRRVLAVAAED